MQIPVSWILFKMMRRVEVLAYREHLQYGKANESRDLNEGLNSGSQYRLRQGVSHLGPLSLSLSDR